MRKLFTAIAFLMLIPVGVAMAMSAADKKDDKKGDKDKDKESDKHQPILILIWEHAWSPVYREVPLQTAIDSICLED